MMAWRPRPARSSGLDDDGDREVSPPGLIIQDELHLISGPARVDGRPVRDGDRRPVHRPAREADPVPPKIIAVDRHDPPVRRPDPKALYGREQVALFPPHGLEDGHSFFAEPDTLPDGTRGTRAPLPRGHERLARLDCRPSRCASPPPPCRPAPRSPRQTATATGPTSTSSTASASWATRCPCCSPTCRTT